MAVDRHDRPRRQMVSPLEGVHDTDAMADRVLVTMLAVLGTAGADKLLLRASRPLVGRLLLTIAKARAAVAK